MSIRIGCVGDAAFELIVRDAVHVLLPDASTARIGIEALRRQLELDALVVDARPGAPTALDAIRLARATGFAGIIAMIVADAAPAPAMEATALGAVSVRESEIVPHLAETIASSTGTSDPARDSVARAQRYLAAGQLALGLQHSLNNPLAGLLAEAQLLEMENLPPETMDAVKRMIDLTRRLVVLVRELDGVGSRRPADNP